MEEWKQELPEEIRNDPSLETIQDIGNLAKSYINAQKLVGADKIILPKEGESWDPVYNKLGRPETPDKYDIKIEGSPEIEKKFKEIAHAQGLNNKQATSLYEWYNGMAQEQYTTPEQAITELRSEWGQETEKNLEKAKRAVELLGGEEIKNMLNQSGFGNKPAFIKFFARLADMTKEDSNKGTPKVTTVDIQGEIDKIVNDRQGPYYNRQAFGHKEAVDKVTELMVALGQAK